jgi:hypothetical protein
MLGSESVKENKNLADPITLQITKLHKKLETIINLPLRTSASISDKPER